jgi:hypothetical protein
VGRSESLGSRKLRRCEDEAIHPPPERKVPVEPFEHSRTCVPGTRAGQQFGVVSKGMQEAT